MLQEEGLALFGLQAEPAGVLFRDAILRLALPVRGTPLPYHTFSQGDIVLLSGTGDIPASSRIQSWTSGCRVDVQLSWRFA